MSKLQAACAPILLIALAGCGSWDDDEDRVPFWGFEQDTDSETETETPQDPGCQEHYLDLDGRCIRYVNFASENPECGFTWNTAFTDIQSGIDSAFAAALIHGGCQVWVAGGLYRSYVWSPTNSIKLRPGVSVFGGFAGTEKLLHQRDIPSHPTIIDGREEDGAGHSYHVVLGSSDSILDGFIVQGGLADGDPPHHRGGGLYLNAASTKVRNCVLRENRAIDGGAVFIYALQPSFADTVFQDNEAVNGGAVYSINGFPSFTDVEFLDNRADIDGGAVFFEQHYGACHPKLAEAVLESNAAGGSGGAVYNRGCSIKIDNVELEGNTAGTDGGAVATYGGSVIMENVDVRGNAAVRDGGGILAHMTKIELNRSVIHDNRANRDAGGAYLITTFGKIFSTRVTGNRGSRNGGGLAVLFDSPWVVNTTVTGNRATSGGGVHNGPRAEPTLINCLLHGNRALLAGGGLFNAELASPEIVNSILWGDLPDEIRNEDGGMAAARFSTIQGGYPGHHVFDLDPLLAKEGHWHGGGGDDEFEEYVWVDGDYSLTGGSPCIDFSDETVAPSHDASGQFWAETPGHGLPGIKVDMGPFDYIP